MSPIPLMTFLVLAAPPLEPLVRPEKEVRDLAPLLEPLRASHDLPALAAAVVTGDGSPAVAFEKSMFIRGNRNL